MTPEEYKQILSRYLPTEAVEEVYNFMSTHGVHLHITRQRYSKLGDYRWPQMGHAFHEISVNGNLNPYHFLMVLLHEMAHLDNYVRFNTQVQPHGYEWQSAYAQRLNEYLYCFPSDLASLVRCYAARIPLSRSVEKEIDALMRHYDAGYDPEQDLTLDQLSVGDCFTLQERPGRRFQVMAKRRTRWLCRDLVDGKDYVVSGNALVTKNNSDLEKGK